MVTPVSVKLSENEKKRAMELAAARDRKPHWIYRQAIIQYLDREEKREALRRDAIAAYEEYRQTGLHVTHNEADAWMKKLESGLDVEPPKCHD